MLRLQALIYLSSHTINLETSVDFKSGQLDTSQTSSASSTISLMSLTFEPSSTTLTLLGNFFNQSMFKRLGVRSSLIIAYGRTISDKINNGRNDFVSCVIHLKRIALRLGCTKSSDNWTKTVEVLTEQAEISLLIDRFSLDV